MKGKPSIREGEPFVIKRGTIGPVLFVHTVSVRVLVFLADKKVSRGSSLHTFKVSGGVSHRSMVSYETNCLFVCNRNVHSGRVPLGPQVPSTDATLPLKTFGVSGFVKVLFLRTLRYCLRSEPVYSSEIRSSRSCASTVSDESSKRDSKPGGPLKLRYP